MTWITRLWARLVAIWQARATLQPHPPVTFPHSDRFRQSLTMDARETDRLRRLVEELWRMSQHNGNGGPQT